MLGNKVTIQDIADAVGVSKSLVSFVMNDKGKKYRVSEEMDGKIREVAHRLNYQPNNAARSLRVGRTGTIGVIVSDISNKFFADIARCIEDCAYKYHYTVIFGSSDENAAKLENLIDVLANKGVDGMIIVPCDGAEEAIRRVAQRNIPLVLLDRRIEDADISYVVLNNKKAMTEAVDRLINEGYKRIEMVSYDMNLSNIKEREAGYVEAMERNGLAYGVNIHRVRFKNLASDTREIIKEIASGRHDVEALVFATNSLTLSGLRSFNEFGIVVPDKMAVVAFDGSEAFDLYYTSVTYVKQPVEQFGIEALELLIKSIEGGSKSFSTVMLESEVVEGDSSKRIREVEMTPVM